ncbi:ATP-binding cassette domain-containing protein [Bifidobacterium callitrichidarum]|nr:ATP-binding cassette domain-containing protein [Bifidobacterium callitrichidarum]
MLTMNGITFTYPDAPEPLFERVDVTFPIGWTSVLGDNGIGKSTLMAIARGRMRPDAGTVTPDPRGMIIGYCPQDAAVEPENLEDFDADWSPEAIAIRDDLGVEDDWPYRYARLSGGQRKRLQIACALALHPDVLILDEPTNHVDAMTREHIITAMRRYRGIGVAVSHDVGLIDAVCTRCAIFERRHVGSRNRTVVATFRGGYSEASQQMELRNGTDAARADAVRREAARLAAVKAQRFAKVQQVEAQKRHGERIDRRDHDARNRRQLAKMTGLDRGVTRAYSQLDGRLAAARHKAEEMSLPAKRYEGTLWMDIEPAHCCELIRLESGVIQFGEAIGRQTAVHRRNRDVSVASVSSSNAGMADMSGLPCDSEPLLSEMGMTHDVAGNGEASASGPNGDDESADSLCRAVRSGDRIRLSPPRDCGAAVGLMIPTISIGPRDHVAVTGPNGTGKSSLIAVMLACAADVPCLAIAQNTTDEDRDAAMRRLLAMPAGARAQVMSAYARLDADSDRLLASGRPSPGELRKLLLCLAIPARPQLMVLDEPTNHLDLTSKKALARLLAEYPGALIVVSHDEWFLKLAGFGR